MQLGRFYHHHDYEQNSFYKKSPLCVVGRSVPDGQVKTYLQLAQKWDVSTIFDELYFFNQHSQTVYDALQKEFDNLEFVHGVIFDFIDSVKNNSTKYFLILDNSCIKICHSKAFVDIGTAGRHR